VQGEGAYGSYDERVLPSIGNEVLKATVAQFDGELYSSLLGDSADIPASELITNREIVSFWASPRFDADG